MRSSASSMDVTSKRWLVVLALVFLGSTAFLGQAFIKALSSPSEDNVAVQPPSHESSREAFAKSEPTWIVPPEIRALDERQTAAGVISTDIKEKPVRKRDEAAAKEAVRSQAEYLRTLVKQNKLPDAYGHLTLEQIDEMEKSNILIE
jgi:hypothetical protein